MRPDESDFGVAKYYINNSGIQAVVAENLTVSY